MHFLYTVNNRFMEKGNTVRWGIGTYPRMRLKRDVLFGFADLWGKYLNMFLILFTRNILAQYVIYSNILEIIFKMLKLTYIFKLAIIMLWKLVYFRFLGYLLFSKTIMCCPNISEFNINHINYKIMTEIPLKPS